MASKNVTTSSLTPTAVGPRPISTSSRARKPVSSSSSRAAASASASAAPPLLVADHAGGQLDHAVVDGGAGLLDQHQLAVVGDGDDDDDAGDTVADDVFPAVLLDQRDVAAFGDRA